jgi:hypothetical protein
MAMFGWKWSDGAWRNTPEPKEQPTRIQPKLKQPPRGFFKHSEPMSRREVALKASNARLWLEYTLREPMPAREVIRLAKLEGLSEGGVRRAKKRLRVKTVKTGGRYRGYGAQWIWQPPVSN